MTARCSIIPRPTVRAPPRGSTIGSVSTIAPADEPATTAPVTPGVYQGGPRRRALEHGLQVHRRSAGQVDKRGVPNGLDVPRVLCVCPAENHEAPRPGPEAGEPGLGGGDGLLGVLVRRGGRKDQNLVGRGRLEQGRNRSRTRRSIRFRRPARSGPGRRSRSASVRVSGGRPPTEEWSRQQTWP